MAVSLAQEKKVVESSQSSPTSVIEVDEITASGQITEARAIYDESGSEIDQVLLAAGFQVGGAKWKTGYWVQVYLQQEDPQNPGNYMGMTCDTEYQRPVTGQSTIRAKQVKIRNTYGGSLSVRDLRNKTWDQIGTQITEDKPGQPFFYESTEGKDPDAIYESKYKIRSNGKKQSYQKCGALATIYHTKDGEEEDTANHVGGNGLYWALKERAEPIELWWGFRVWEDASQTTTIQAADGGMFTYQMFDFADPPLVKAQPKPEEPEEEEDSEPETDTEEIDTETEPEVDVEPVSLKTEGSSGAVTQLAAAAIATATLLLNMF